MKLGFNEVNEMHFLNVGSEGEARFTTSVASSRSFARRNISVAKAGNYRTCFSPYMAG
jgi:hypothetical protein